MTDDCVSACNLEWLESAMERRRRGSRPFGIERTFQVTFAPPIRKPTRQAP